MALQTYEAEREGGRKMLSTIQGGREYAWQWVMVMMGKSKT